MKRRKNKESSRMSRAQEKEMDQDRMVEEGNRMEEIQIEHDGDRMTLMDLDIGESLSAADTRRSPPGLPDPSNGPWWDPPSRDGGSSWSRGEWVWEP